MESRPARPDGLLLLAGSHRAKGAARVPDMPLLPAIVPILNI
jgi:hypothetical protein